MILVKVLLKLFSTLVSVAVLCCCVMWGAICTNVISDIDKLQLKFCKLVLGVQFNSTNFAVSGS